MASQALDLLNDVLVIDASRVLAGPFCGQLLGDLGAEVIKIEHPRQPDETRGWGPPFQGELSAYYLSCNRNKKALTLDLAHAEGRAIFHKLIARSDVLLENFRGASISRLGLTAGELHAVNPKLIVCSISGFGRTGPLAALPGYDFAIQALSGLMAITGPPDGPPFKVGVAVADILTGLNAAAAVLACLHARKRSGHGYHIDLALLDCALAAQVNVAQAYLTSGQVPARQGNAHLQIVPYEMFATEDGWLVLAVGNDGQWQRFCHAAGETNLAADARFRTNEERVRLRDELVPRVASIMKERSTRDWEERLLAAEVPHAPVQHFDQLFASEHAEARGLRLTVRDPSGQPVDLIGSPFHIAGAGSGPAVAPPRLGQDTDHVLRSLLGLSVEDVASLRRGGII
jgi:crotonobetainyl-CoA:carnitine CoA-transferase CaiB-like acyl-CoA transferase